VLKPNGTTGDIINLQLSALDLYGASRLLFRYPVIHRIESVFEKDFAA
jgi:hypothetical protein